MRRMMLMSKRKKEKRFVYVPCTPAGTPLIELAAATEEAAWARLLQDAAHMPYKGKEGFQQRGYTVEEWPEDHLS
jgi:hypothetical protein